MPRHRSLALPLLLAASLAGAQPSATLPKRPALQATQDTNSAPDYYQYGLEVMMRQPAVAADAFYWASRLQPLWAEPYYARRIALHLTNPDRLLGYVERRRGVVENAEVQRIDSLQLKALVRNPWLYQGLNRKLLEKALRHLTGEGVSQLGGTSGDPFWDAWMAYGDRDFAKAARLYGQALKREPKAFWLHEPRAQAFFALARYDSATAEMRLLLEGLRKPEKDRIVYVYESKALYEYGIGIAHAVRNDVAAAREAYGRALSEDLSFYMAHAAMGELALQQGDTAAALNEYQTAISIQPEDGTLHLSYAVALLQAGRAEDAVNELKLASRYEPYYATPYLYLGRLYDRAEMTNEAVEQYDAYLAHASRNTKEYEGVKARLAVLRPS